MNDSNDDDGKDIPAKVIPIGLLKSAKPDDSNPGTVQSVAQHLGAVQSQIKNNIIMNVLKHRLGLEEEDRENPKMLTKAVNQALSAKRLTSIAGDDGTEYFSLDKKLVLTIFPLRIEVEEDTLGASFTTSFGYEEALTSH